MSDKAAVPGAEVLPSGATAGVGAGNSGGAVAVGDAGGAKQAVVPVSLVVGPALGCRVWGLGCRVWVVGCRV